MMKVLRDTAPDASSKSWAILVIEAPTSHMMKYEHCAMCYGKHSVPVFCTPKCFLASYSDLIHRFNPSQLDVQVVS
jgi:hypothetical protein